MRPRMSATPDTRCVAHPDVFAYQMGSGAAPLPSVAVTVSPERQSFSPLGYVLIPDCFMTYLLSFLLPQQGIVVLILASQLVPQEQGTYLELTTQ